MILKYFGFLATIVTFAPAYYGFGFGASQSDLSKNEYFRNRRWTLNIREHFTGLLENFRLQRSGIFLSSHRFESAPVSPPEREFLINGWRWHTRVAVRETSRLHELIQLLISSPDVGDYERVGKCYDYVWNFVFKKLHMIEDELYFPWLHQKLPGEVYGALKEYENGRNQIKKLGVKLGTAVASLNRVGPNGYRSIAVICRELEKHAFDLQNEQERYLMPYVAAYVDTKHQNKFNSDVISKLGIADSQVLLVAMSDTLQNNPAEYSTFCKEVPKVVRLLIPTWRRVLYNRKAKYLEWKKAEMKIRQ